MAQVRWTSGGEADVVLFQGERIELQSSVPAAPGTPLDGTLTEAGQSLRVKVHGCRKLDGGFRIHGRVIDLRRELRPVLEGLRGALPGEG